MGNGSKSMEQHRDELNQNDRKEEEYQNDAYRFQVEVLFGDEDLYGWKVASVRKFIKTKDTFKDAFWVVFSM